MNGEERSAETTGVGASPKISPASIPNADAGDASGLQDMTLRVGELERGYRRLLEAENERLRAELQSLGSPQTIAVGQPRETPLGDDPSSPALHAPAYLTGAVIEVERRCDEMEMYARLENWSAARSAKLAAATTACRTLRRVCGDREFAARLRQLSVHARQQEQQVLSVVPGVPGQGNIASPIAGAAAGPTPQWTEFLRTETELLQILGMSAELAEAHVSLGHDAFILNPQRHLAAAQSPEQFIDLLEALRDDICMSADVMALGIRSENSRKLWKRILVNGMSGTFVVGANAAAGVLLGPLAVAISGAFGSAAVGIAVEAVNG